MSNLPPGTTPEMIDVYFAENPGTELHHHCWREPCERRLEHMDEKRAGLCRSCHGLWRSERNSTIDTDTGDDVVS
jgi:hypothetical protein